MLKLNVGFTKKIGLPNYGSCGAAVHLEVEAESGLLDRPDELHARIQDLFVTATDAVEGQLRASTGQEGVVRVVPAGARRHGRQATARQIQALLALAARQERDPAELASACGVAVLADLSLVAASQLIDRLQRTTDGEAPIVGDPCNAGEAA